MSYKRLSRIVWTFSIPVVLIFCDVAFFNTQPCYHQLRLNFRIARHPVAFIHQLVKLIVRHSLSSPHTHGETACADHNDSAVGDVIPISIMFRVIADVLAIRYRDAFVENGFTNLAA